MVTRRQRQQSLLAAMAHPTVFSNVLEFLGSRGTAQCMSVCRSWCFAARNNPFLWQGFCQREFNLSGFGVVMPAVPGEPVTLANDRHHPYHHQQQHHHSVSPDTNSHHNILERYVPETRWRMAYNYLARHYRTYQNQVVNQDMKTNGTVAPRLEGRVVFADDGGHFPGYPAEFAISSTETAWCTARGVQNNVDLVVELKSTSIITGFLMANGGRGYSAPLHNALIFVSMDPPNLDAARIYDGSNGSAWVQKLYEQKNNIVVSGKKKPKHCRQAKRCPSGYVPVEAVRFPHGPSASYGRAWLELATPIVGRYIHFKLLSSHTTPQWEEESDNIDIMHCHTMGTAVGDLDFFIPAIAPSKPIPVYKRVHPIPSASQGEDET